VTFAVVRIRGTVNVRGTISDTLKFMRLNRVNHCVLLHDSPQVRGMLQKAKDYITWGEIEEKTLSELLKKRGRLMGDKALNDAHIKKNSDWSSVKDFSKAIMTGKTSYGELKEVKPILRLSPPKKGHGGIKRAYNVGGALGYRGEDINELLMRMM